MHRAHEQQVSDLMEYLLALDGPLDQDVRRQYARGCGATIFCRSMLADVG